MTITRKQVADLQPGDVVELHYVDEDGRSAVGGQLRSHAGSGLSLHGGLVVRRADGDPASTWLDYSLIVISRAPRPLYVNHPRTKPVPGDVVRDADDRPGRLWMFTRPDVKRPWVHTSDNHLAPDEMPDRLRLLVDGETGQVVQ